MGCIGSHSKANKGSWRWTHTSKARAPRLLAENGHQVLLLEAGPPANWFMTIPYICASFQKTPYDWQYKSVPQEHGEFRYWKGMNVI